MNTLAVLHELEQLHPNVEGEWSFHREVFGIDAYAVRLWQGRDAPHYRRVGYEVKVSRSDFLTELKKPEKRATAMALSHQFYLAMPSALAERCLPDVEAKMPGVGLLAVHEEAVPSAWKMRAPCVGAVTTGRIRVLRRADIRPCRGWTAREWSNLMRRQHRTPVEADEYRRWGERATADLQAANRQLRVVQDKLDAAHHQLAKLTAGGVRDGQVFEGTWRDEEKVRARVVGGSITMAMLDENGDPRSGYGGGVYVSPGELAASWTPVPEVAVPEEGG